MATEENLVNGNRIFPEQDIDLYTTPYRPVGKYSFWRYGSPTQALTGAPLHDHTPGQGRHPHDFMLSGWFTGLQTAGLPTTDPGKGTRLSYGRLHWLQYHGLDQIFATGYGHDPGRITTTSLYSNYIYHGLDIDRALRSAGHAPRYFGDVGVPAGFGRYRPYDIKGKKIGAEAVGSPGQHIPADYSNAYGHNRVQEWRGISKAIF